MINWRFFLDTEQFDEPDNFSDLLLMLKRDEAYHGVFFEASISSLSFSGEAALYIMDIEDEQGLLGQITFRAESNCDGDVWTEEIRGTLNLGKLKRYCSAACRVVVPIEQVNCTMLLRNRFDQKVDLDDIYAFDKVTPLEIYEYGGVTVTMPSKALRVGTTGQVAEEGDFLNWNVFTQSGPVFGATAWVRPSYMVEKDKSLVTSELIPTVFAADNSTFMDSIVSPVVLLDDATGIDCFQGNFAYSGRLKGRVRLNRLYNLNAVVLKGTPPVEVQYPLDVFNPDILTYGMTILFNESLAFDELGDVVELEFDTSFSGSTPLDPGQSIFVYLQANQLDREVDDNKFIEFDQETFIDIQAVQECPTTDGKVYMINEALSHVVEAITNACLKVRSDYYGRTDSRPYSATEDGCGGLRAINSGLQLRNAIDAKAFVSLKDMFEGLNPIDNIGFGLEADPDRPGFDQLRVEPVEYWYREQEVLALDLADDVVVSTLDNEAIANIKVGYQKWEVESVNGLDEVNANREFRTLITTVNNTLSILSKFVAGSYAIEITRQQNYADTGAADTTYDNETFIYCMLRQLYGFTVEQGGVTNPLDFFSPTTIFNWRIRPFYNLMRWFKTIAAAYPNVGDTEKKLFFAAGTGNYRASGELTSGCKLESHVVAENQDLSKADFVGGDFQPLWRVKEIQFKYPLSLSEYKRVKDNPYGYIKIQCGTGEWLKGFINSIQYSPFKGEAEFNLKLAWLQ